MHWRGFERCLVVLAVLALAVPATAAGQSWSKPQPLGPGNGIGAGVSVATDDAGRALIGYTDGRTLQVRERSPSGGLGPPQDVARAGSNEILGKAELAMDADGSAVIAWPVQVLPGHAQVWAATRAAGAPFGPAQLVAADGMRFDLAIARGGWAALIWTHWTDLGEPQYPEASVRPPGGSFEAPVALDSGTDPVEFPRIAIDDTGAATATWDRWDLRPQMAVRPADGDWGAAQPFMADEFDFVPDLGVDRQGNALALGARHGPDGVPIGVGTSARPAGAPEFGRVDAVSPDVNGLGGRLESPATLGFDASGAATFLWLDADSQHLYASRRLTDGTIESGSQLSDEAAWRPALAVSPGGSAFAVWTQWLGGDVQPVPRPLWASRRATGDARFGPRFDVPRVGYGALDYDVAATPEGGALVAWAADFGYDCTLAVVSEFSPDGTPSMDNRVAPPECARTAGSPWPAPIFGDNLPPTLDFFADDGERPVERHVAVALRCSEDCTAVVRGTLVRRRSRLALKPVIRKLRGGRRAHVMLALPRRAARRLGGRPRKLLLKVSVTDRARNRTTRRHTISLGH